MVNASKAWVFQANPERYNIKEAINHMHKIDWRVNQYSNEMSAGDIVYIWMSGPEAGIYAQAILTEAPSKRAPISFDENFFNKKEPIDAQEYVLLEIQRRFLHRPLLKSTMKDYEILKDLNIVTAPMGTNFRIPAEPRLLIEDILKTLI